MLNFRACILRLLANNRDIDRRLTPAIDVKAKMQNLSLNNRPSCLLHAKICTWQENLPNADRILRRLMPGAAHLIAEKGLRHLEADTRAITCLTIGIDRAPVPDILERFDTHFNDFTARLTVQRSNQANTASAMLIFRVIGMAIDQALTIFKVFCCKCHVEGLTDVVVSVSSRMENRRRNF